MFPMCVVYLQLKFQGGSTESAERRETQRISWQGEEKRSEVLLAPVRPLACTYN